MLMYMYVCYVSVCVCVCVCVCVYIPNRLFTHQMFPLYHSQTFCVVGLRLKPAGPPPFAVNPNKNSFLYLLFVLYQFLPSTVHCNYLWFLLWKGLGIFLSQKLFIAWSIVQCSTELSISRYMCTWLALVVGNAVLLVSYSSLNLLLFFSFWQKGTCF